MLAKRVCMRGVFPVALISCIPVSLLQVKQLTSFACFKAQLTASGISVPFGLFLSNGACKIFSVANVLYVTRPLHSALSDFSATGCGTKFPHCHLYIAHLVRIICNTETIVFALNEFIVGYWLVIVFISSVVIFKCSEWGFLLHFAIIGHVSMEIQGSFLK